MKAINNFDTSYNVMFSTYAVPIILGEIKRYFRDEGQMKISRSMKERYLQVQKSRERLAQKLPREPTYREIGEDLGCLLYTSITASKPGCACSKAKAMVSAAAANRCTGSAGCRKSPTG